MSESIYCVYKHTSPSGKAYIGQTNNYVRRCSEHKNHSRTECRNFQKAIKKYGWDNFKHEILAENLTLEQANDLEEIFIIQHETLSPKGYNLKHGGNNASHSEETIKRMIKTRQNSDYKKAHSIRQREIHNRPELIALASKKTSEYFSHEENRKKQSTIQKECQNREDVRRKKSETSKIVMNKPEVKKKVSEGVKRAFKKEGHKEKMSLAMKKSHSRPEVRKKLSESIKKAQSKDGYKEKISLALRLALSDESVKKKMSDSAKKRVKRNRERKIEMEKEIAKSSKCLFEWMQSDLF